MRLLDRANQRSTGGGWCCPPGRHSRPQTPGLHLLTDAGERLAVRRMLDLIQGVHRGGVGQLAEGGQVGGFDSANALPEGNASGTEIAVGQHAGDQGTFQAAPFLALDEEHEGDLLPHQAGVRRAAEACQLQVEQLFDQLRVAVDDILP